MLVTQGSAYGATLGWRTFPLRGKQRRDGLNTLKVCAAAGVCPRLLFPKFFFGLSGYHYFRLLLPGVTGFGRLPFGNFLADTPRGLALYAFTRLPAFVASERGFAPLL